MTPTRWLSRVRSSSACTSARRALLLAAAAALVYNAPLHAGDTLADAVALFKARRYPEARAAFERVVATEPKNAAACHYLGLTWKYRNDTEALEQAVKWLARAVELAPNNATYLAEFGAASLQLASRTRSYTAATRGRDAMEKALTINPDDVDAHEGLFQFYTQAPWPLGSSTKAAVHLEAIRKRDPDRATVLAVIARANARDFAAAFALCDEVLARSPDNYIALYQYGRTAAVSGQNLQRGLERLQKCVTLPPPTPASPSHSNVWQRIGNLQEQLGRPMDARAAYETALKLDPGNRQAANALANLN